MRVWDTEAGEGGGGGGRGVTGRGEGGWIEPQACARGGVGEACLGLGLGLG